MTQRDRVLRALERGPVPATAFAAPDVVDGGKPVFRVAARIGELRDAGYEILTTRAPNGVAVYHLVCDAGLAGGDDRDAPDYPGGPTDPAEPASSSPAGGHPLVHAAVASADQARPASARVNGLGTAPPPSGAEQLFNPDEVHGTRPHYAVEEAA